MSVAKPECRCSTCGAKFIYRKVCANSTAARSFEEWAPEHINECEECRAKRKLQERDEENAKNAEISKEMGYPDLKGTEKQVTWAVTIRKNMMEIVRAYYFDPTRAKKFPKQTKMAFDGLSEILLAHTSAGWWIDNRCTTLREIVLRLSETDKDAYKALEAKLKSA